MSSPKNIYLNDYKSPHFYIKKTELIFDLYPTNTTVEATLEIARNGKHSHPLVLSGKELTLLEISIDNTLTDKFSLNEEELVIASVPDKFTLKTKVEIKPEDNASLEGLYLSNGIFCSHCEAESFRKITYYIDRPDVLSSYTTTIIANKSHYPTLLSNGNLIKTGEIDEQRHWATWQDPFPKPAYLFAMVAGNLASITDKFITCSGKEILLTIFSRQQYLDQCEHAMVSLKNAMKWDEQAFGREYDLDNYMIVAIDDFNSGAMENKGLNIFNTSCLLAKPDTATDIAYQRVENVVGHEYFHNWSGNRVTCRDWFQLSLKEGFTVFREQQFAAAMGSPTTKRIEDVNYLRAHQFPEDAGALAHPVRPSSYIEISNFYTATIYEKGAEIINMLQNLLGKKLFRQGCDLYFSRFDGQAATTDDFRQCMEEISGVDLTQFQYWYEQAGTPEVNIESIYDQNKKTYTLNIEQYCSDTPGQINKEPFHIPIYIGLLDKNGNEISLSTDNIEYFNSNSNLINLTQAKQTISFSHVESKPIPSLLRNFSAPIKVNYDYTDEELVLLILHDTDGFNRWEACQRLMMNMIKQLINNIQQNQPIVINNPLVDIFKTLLLSTKNNVTDKQLTAKLLTLPDIAFVCDQFDQIDIDGIFAAIKYIQEHIANMLYSEFYHCYQLHNIKNDYQFNSHDVGARSLKNICLEYLMATNNNQYIQLCCDQFYHANNMTDRHCALSSLVNTEAIKEKDEALSYFYSTWQQEPLVVNQWFAIQAKCQRSNTLANIKHLQNHSAFNIKNPNKVYALIGTYTKQNLNNFHEKSGDSYHYLVNNVCLIDKFNPKMAARLLSPFSQWQKYDQLRQDMMHNALAKILSNQHISKDIYEITHKIMGS